MDENSLIAERERGLEAAAAPHVRMVEALRDLVRNGYAVDPEGEGEGLLLRHKVAPALILSEDGTIALAHPLAGPRGRFKRSGNGGRRIHWRRTFVVTVLGASAWAMSVFVGVMVLSA